MKKFSSILLVAILPLIKAQISYTAADYASSQDQVSYSIANLTNNNDFAQTGSNHTWSYNSLTESTSKDIGYISPSVTGYKSIWCLLSGYITNCDSQYNNNFNLAQKLVEAPAPQGTNVVIDAIFMHSSKTNTVLENRMIGLKVISNNQTVPVILQYQQPDIIYKFPMNFGDMYSEPFTMNANLTSVGIDFQLTNVGIRTNNVDGWGTLTVNNKSYADVIRLKTISDQQITRTQSGVTENMSIKTINYQWFSKDHKLPVLDVMGVESNDTFFISEIKYLKDDAVLDANLTNLRKDIIYPNPTDDIFKTSIPASEIVSIEVYNQTGQLVNNSLNVRNLPKGTYIIKIKTLTNVYSQKVIKN